MRKHKNIINLFYTFYKSSLKGYSFFLRSRYIKILNIINNTKSDLRKAESNYNNISNIELINNNFRKGVRIRPFSKMENSKANFTNSLLSHIIKA